MMHTGRLPAVTPYCSGSLAGFTARKGHGHTSKITGSRAQVRQTRRRNIRGVSVQCVRTLTKTTTAPSGEPRRPTVWGKEVQLDKLSKDYLKPDSKLLGPQTAGVFGADRPATALIFEPTDAPFDKPMPAIVFGHGFSQPPPNYMSTIEAFCKKGWLVIAPTTGIQDILLKDIEGTKGRFDKMPSKLQTALILDLLRCVQYLRSHPDYQGRVSDIAWSGHSLGAASAIIAASHCKPEDAKAVAVFAPQLSQMSKTIVNDDIFLAKTSASVKACFNFFSPGTSEFSVSTPLILIGGDDDLLAPAADIELMFSIAYKARKGDGVVAYVVNGSHIGFEDRVNVEDTERSPLLNVLFELINFLVYNVELLKFLVRFGDPSEQKLKTQQLVTESFQSVFGQQESKLPILSGDWKTVDRPSTQLSGVIDDLLDDDVSMDFNITPTALLASYAIAQSIIAGTAGHLLYQAVAEGGGSLNSIMGLSIAYGTAASLTFDNALLASGRLFKDNTLLLKSLSSFRFVAHSCVPLMVLTGMDVADRAGVEWVNSPTAQGLIGLFVLGSTGISAMRNTLLLEIGPVWQQGILRFTFSRPEFVRLLPAIGTCVLLSVLGYQATGQSDNLWPTFVGPLICLILSAIPSRVAMPVLTGNLGEVLLVGSLVYGEWVLRSAGL